MLNLTYNLLTFDHPVDEFTLYFTNTYKQGLYRIYAPIVPNEVIKKFGKQDYYYTSFDCKQDNFLPVLKKSKPTYLLQNNKSGKSIYKQKKNSAFHKSILKQYYNKKIYSYFFKNNVLLKPPFLKKVEIWLPSTIQNLDYLCYDKYTVEVQIAKITNQPELLVAYNGIAKVLHKSIADYMSQISPSYLNWTVYQNILHKYDKLPENARQNLENTFPVLNNKISETLHIDNDSCNNSNQYIIFNKKINSFFLNHLNKDAFKQIIPINSKSFISVPKSDITIIDDKKNLLIFNKNTKHKSFLEGIKNGPFKTSPHSKIKFFFIYHSADRNVAQKINAFFEKGYKSYKGLYNFIKIPYYRDYEYDIVFNNKENPVKEIQHILFNEILPSEIHFIAIYLSPFNKYKSNYEQKSMYYKIKELLLYRTVISQVIDVNNFNYAIKNDTDYDLSLKNISIALLAKLNGIPWQINTNKKNQLIIGVGAFTDIHSKINIICNASRFSNIGNFNRFECFYENQTDEFIGLIIYQIQEYIEKHSTIDKLIIHSYKNIETSSLERLNKSMKSSKIFIPIFFISIEKSKSHDILAFDNTNCDIVPKTGTYINLGNNKYLLFNNPRYISENTTSNNNYPLPLILNLKCTNEKLIQDKKIVAELIDEIYQFSQLYWKSTSHQNLPITIKYPTLIAEFFPYFDGFEIPTYGQDKLWFL